MALHPDDPVRWPVSKFVREVLPTQPDGRVVLISLVLNWGAGLLAGVTLLLNLNVPGLAWVHVLLFCGMPVVGFVWFLRDSVGGWRQRWRVMASVAFQIFLAAVPWCALLAPLFRQQA